MCACLWAPVCHGMHLEVRGYCGSVFLPFHLVGSKDESQVISLANKYLYLSRYHNFHKNMFKF